MKTPPQIVAAERGPSEGGSPAPRADARFLSWVMWVGGSLGLGGIVLLFLFDPVQHAFFPRCVFHSFSGLDCPGCGSLRATHNLLHGRVIAALNLNPLFCLLLPVGVWYGARSLLRQLAGRALPNPFRKPVWTWVLVWMVIAFWIVRNIPNT